MKDNNNKSTALSSFVDRVYAVCYTGYKDRYPTLMEELGRVGLADKTTVIWQFPTPYNPFLASHIPHIEFLDQHPGCWGAIWGQYEAIKTGYHLGLERIMIVEDDCRFLKDLAAVDSALSEAPSNWDVLMLDHFKVRGREFSPIKSKWTPCRASASTACYIVNRRAMERLIAMYESPVSGRYARPIMRNCDHWTDKKYLGGDIGFYVATPNLAVQCTCPGASNCGRLHCIDKYQDLGLNLSDYQPFSSSSPTPAPTPVAAPISNPTTPPTATPQPSTLPPSTITPPTPVDVLYVVGPGAADYDNLPLRWSLRSLAKHAKNIGRVIVAGQPPKWLSDRVVKVPVQDTGTGKHWNILNCIAQGIRAAGIDRPFLYSSDDHFLCKDADFAQWPRLERGRLLSYEEYIRAKNVPPNKYQRSLCDTHKCLTLEHLSVRKACLHFNTWMDGRDLDEVLALAERHRKLTMFGFEPTCLFNAIFEKKHPNSPYTVLKPGEDRKIHTAQDIDNKIKAGARGFSTSPKAETDKGVIDRMNALFPTPSPWEKPRDYCGEIIHAVLSSRPLTTND